MVPPKERHFELPSQTAGPYLHIGLMPNFAGIEGVYAQDLGAVMVNEKTCGQRICIRGRVFDGKGETLNDAVVEIWQADHLGRFPGKAGDDADPSFTGFGRTACDLNKGEFEFQTIKPGAVPSPGGGMQAPHITFWIVARGINIGLHTRMYFADEEALNDKDPVLSHSDVGARAKTLIAETTGAGSYRFDIHLQGDEETVFFDV